MIEQAARVFRSVFKRRDPRPYRVGWVCRDPRLPSGGRLGRLAFMPRLRAKYLSDWIHAHSDSCSSELYDPSREYDVVIFVKEMQPESQDEVRRIHAYGGKVIFDANVNYYEIWGEYVQQAPPSLEQQAQAIWMTEHADAVIADSSYIAARAGRYNPRTRWIPDNINMAVFSALKDHRQGPRIVLGWSGIPSKAHHLLDIVGPLSRVPGLTLRMVTGQPGDRVVPAEVMRELEAALPCHVVPFSEKRLVRSMLASDVVISPKRLGNSYDMGHTELKIAVGMALGLPAVASPQPSYKEAVEYKGGGFIVSGIDEWCDALTRLKDASLRRELGRRARETVLAKYSVPVVARQFIDVIREVVCVPSPARGSDGENSVECQSIRQDRRPNAERWHPDA